VVGQAPRAGAVAKSILREAATTGSFEDPPNISRFTFSEADLSYFKQTLIEAQRAVAEAKLVVPSDPHRQARWQRFADTMLEKEAGPIQELLTAATVRATFAEYCQYRAHLIASGRPRALAEMPRIAIPLAYMLREGGAAPTSDALLRDLLTVQMRLTLREESGPVLWPAAHLGIRDTVRFALELQRLDTPRPGEAGAAVRVLWDVEWPAGTFADVLGDRIGTRIHPDVLVRTAGGGDQRVLLYNLLLQLDAWSGTRELPRGFLSPDFVAGSEFQGDIRTRFNSR
jgi:hypothetical protein